MVLFHFGVIAAILFGAGMICLAVETAAAKISKSIDLAGAANWSGVEKR